MGTINIYWRRVFPHIGFSRGVEFSLEGLNGEKDTIMSNTLLDMDFLGSMVLLERHDKKICTCSYCTDSDIWSLYEKRKFGWKRPADRTGWNRFYLKTNKYTYYLRVVLKDYKKAAKKFEKLFFKKYIIEDAEKLLYFMSVERDGPVPILKRDKNIQIGLPGRASINLLPLIKKKLEEMPLYISHANKDCRAFAKWRLHAGK